MSDALSKLRRTWYVWDMARSKVRIKPATKRRLRTEFEDAVLEYAAEIANERYLAEQMKEYRDAN